MSVVSGEREAFRLTRTGPEWRDHDVGALRDTFNRQHCVKLPGFIEAPLLRQVHRLVASAAFAEFVHEGIASELQMTAGVCTGVLDFLVNDPRLFEFVRAVTGCAPIRAFVGRVYRRCPGTAHHDSWHDDLGRQRMIGNHGRLLHQRHLEPSGLDVGAIELQTTYPSGAWLPIRCHVPAPAESVLATGV